jgi:DNA polymerase-3 subunit gamma/tau
VEAPLALYRRYRPDTFAEVIGQEHVTTPLSHALANNRVHHAYLFSGPRGCGKTTSARILARALNCESGPTPTPCGECDSCRELARGGPGSIDVIEIDAASHGGVDDARDLRERAFFAPVKSRYKVYIIDEAHMVTTQGFNALLKLVEEPPSHLRFIFATTEPEKVIGTIKSRTHHYPFRLVPPKVLGEYVDELSRREGVTLEPNVVPLLVRAGAGSVRDTLSVLDQLIGGAGPEGVTYSLATALLGYTPDSLLDEAVDAIAAHDGATLFGVIEKVVETGQDPRRFAEDLLHRLRDLVVISAVPDAASRGLIELSGDQAERLGGQASRFGRAELTRAADLVSAGLTEMRGATAPRLLLEILCARILLPALDDTAEGFGSRLDRVERRLSVVGEVSQPAAAGARAPAPVASAPSRADATDASSQLEQGSVAVEAPVAGAARPTPGQARTAPPVTQPTPTIDAEQEHPAATAQGTRGPASATPSAGGSTGELGLVDVRRLWPGVLERVKRQKRYAWMLLSKDTVVKDVHDGTLLLGMREGQRANFLKGGHQEILRQALIDELGVDWKVEVLIDGAPAPESTGSTAGAAATPESGSPSPTDAEALVPPTGDARGNKARAIRQSSQGSEPAESQPEQDEHDEPHDDDEVVPDDALSSHELLARELGAEIIEEREAR